MTYTKLIDHRVILLKNYYEYNKGEEFRCNGFYYHPVQSDGRILEVEFVQKRKDLFKEKK